MGFNAYARVMIPISLAGALLTFAVLRLHFHGVLASAVAASLDGPVAIPTAHRGERSAVVLLLLVFAAYPVMAAVGGPVWSVSVAGAVLALFLAWRFRVATARKVAGHVSMDILVFLWGVFLVVVGLRHVGVDPEHDGAR